MRRIFEGAFASTNPRTTTLAGAGQLRAAEPDGIAVGRFGWADRSTGYARNERTASDQLLGFVLPYVGRGQRAYVNAGLVYVRPGLEVTLCSRGDFYARFIRGARAGDRVYASLVDGSVISGSADDTEITPWFVVTSSAPGQLAIISPWRNP